MGSSFSFSDNITGGLPWENPKALLSPGQAHGSTGGGFDLGSEEGQFISMFSDPIDLFGERAQYAQQQTDASLMGAANRSIQALRDQYYKTQELQKPFYDLGVQGLGQFGQYQKGPEFDASLQEGARALRGSYGAAGLGQSSAAARGIGDFVNQLTAEDVQRQYERALNNVRIGQGAVGAIGQAGSNVGQGAGSIYGNLGSLLGQSALNYGAQRQQSYNDLATTLAGLGSYLGSK